MKFAYIIMAHDNQRQLLFLLQHLDFEENDIYLHIDKKCKSMDLNLLKSSVRSANIFIYRKFDVKWAGVSQTKCQVFMLSEAIKTYHDYYHLISGKDFPIQSNTVIQHFFELHKGKEFVHFESDFACNKDNCSYYYFGESIFSKLLLQLQKKLKVKRTFYCGANWFSITHRLASDFCEHKNMMLKKIRMTKSSDEYILQTFIKMVSKNEYTFYDNIRDPYNYKQIVRLIDWNRGNPYVWMKENFDEIINSDRMFARKFDDVIDNDIIRMISEFIT